MKIMIQGERDVLSLQVAKKDVNGVVRPIDLTGNSEITASLKLGSTVLKKYRVTSPIGVTVVGPATDGKLQVELTSAETLAFAKGTGGTLEIKVDMGAGAITKFQLKNAFQVDEGL